MKMVPEHLTGYFEQAGKKRSYPAGAILYMQGDPDPTICLIRKGRVRMFYMSDSGKEITFQIIG